MTDKLTARRVMTAPPGKYCDGHGLWLVVRPGGSRHWVFRYTYHGRRREMGLGPVHTVSLKEARAKARQARVALHAGRDPMAERQAKKGLSFRAAAEAFLEAHEEGWTNPKHRQQWRNTLETYAFPVLGDMPVEAIDTEQVLAVLKPIWTAKPVTASRLRGRIERVLDWAKVRGYRRGENPARWRGHLEALLPAKTKLKAVKHHAALPFREIPAFMAALRARAGVAARALEFLVLTAARSGEVRGARWDEIDLEEGVWTVPAARMKAKRDHRVPLSKPAVAILEDMQALSGGERFIFPGLRHGRPLSEKSLAAVLERMGRTDLTVHGFRSTFRDWAAECTDFPREVAEQALAHAISNQVEAAYRRGDLFTKRRALMDAWARYCLQTPGEVVRLPR